MYRHCRDASNAPKFSIHACILDTGAPINVRSFSGLIDLPYTYMYMYM